MPDPNKIEKTFSTHQCSACYKSFSTNSHLRRHEVSHSRNRLNQCSFCGRRFFRHDALRRHSKTCSLRGERDELPTSKPGRKSHACDPCRSKKTQCDGGNPCKRCSSSRLKCSHSYVDCGPVGTITNCTPTNGQIARYASNESDPQHIPVSFLLNFTDPSIQATTDVSSAPGALPGVIPEQTHYHTLNYELPDYVFDGEVDGIYSEFFMDQSIESAGSGGPALSGLAMPALQIRIEELLSQLSAQYELDIATHTLPGPGFPISLAKIIFTPNNLSHYAMAYFNYFHPHFPLIHRPTFHIQIVSLPLLLAVTLSGSVHAKSKDDALSARHFFSIAEAYIFGILHELSANNARLSEYSLQVVQAGFIMHTLLISCNDESIRRRIRVNRHPELIASIRSLGLTGTKRTAGFAPKDWYQFIAEEMRVRLVTGAFVLDCMSTMFFNNPPTMTINEMFGDFPCADILFEAPTSTEFAQLATIHSPSLNRLPSWKDLISMYLHETWPGPEYLTFASVEPKHLVIILFALQSIIFVARIGLLVPASYKALIRATNRWKELWDVVNERYKAEQPLPLGFTTHGLEFWWLAQKVLELAKCGDSQSKYMEGIPADSLKDLHDFLQLYADRGT